MSEASFPRLSGLVDRLMAVKHPILLLLAVGIVIRLAVMSTSMVYDLDYWAVVIRNIEAGNGLYDAEGYYYTPVWGYILGLIAALQEHLLFLGEFAVRVIEAFPVEYIPGTYYSATAPSLAFIYSVKIPLMFFDVIMAFLVMAIVKDFTGDSRKSVVAFALTFLCPVVFCSSAMICMPDNIAVVFALLTVLLLRRGAPFMAGMTFALAVLTKFFPAFFIFVLVAYLLMRNDTVSAGARQVGLAACGAAIMTAVVFLPQIATGNIDQCFQFLSDRSFSTEGGTILQTLINMSRVMVYVAVLALSVVAAWIIIRRRGGDPYERLLKACLIIATLCLVYPPTTQYMVLVVPFLAIYAASRDTRYVYCWMIMGVGALISVYTTTGLTLMPLAAWTDLIPIDSVLGVFEWTDSTMVGPFSLRSLQFLVGGLIQCLGVLSVLYVAYGDEIRARLRRGGASAGA